MNYPIISSPYGEDAANITLEVHRMLLASLNLPSPFRSTDPEIGEAYGLLSPSDISDLGEPSGLGTEIYLNFQFIASAAFENYWEAMSWAIQTGMNLHNLIPQMDKRLRANLSATALRCFSAVERTSSITVGNPRAPLQQPQGQQSHAWIVDVLCPCRIRLKIASVPGCGHR